MQQPDRQGILIILSSPSGAGKSTLTRELLKWDPEISFSISATTRAMRPGEVEAEHYYFMDRANFEAKAADGEMLEWAEVFGNLYGSPLGPVDEAIRAGNDVLFDVDWQGGQQIRNSALRDAAVSIFILPPSIAELEARLIGRGQDSAEVVAGRMAKSRAEISHWAEYDYVLLNDDLERCREELIAIVRAERLRRDRRSGLVPFVRGLEAEFMERNT